MSDIKWTKGDWKVREDGTNSGEWLEVFIEGAHFDDDSEFVIAELGTVRSKPDGKNWIPTEDATEHTANAYLIAAAPKLYEALGDVMPHLNELPTETYRLLARRFHDVLAEARGESL